MKTHAVKGLVKCPTHDTYIIKCHCPVDTADKAGARLKRLGIKTEPEQLQYEAY